MDATYGGPVIRILPLAVALSLFTPALQAGGESPYAGEETRSIKALSDDEIASYLSGKGMGYAKAAELNGYPGPLHALALSEKLALSPQQLAATRASFEQMQREARNLGASLVETERELDRLFAERRADVAGISELLQRIARLQAELRLTHLTAHLRQTGIMRSEQIAEYAAMRGYHSHGSSH